MLYFRRIDLARELSIRTQEDGKFNDYEHSELSFRLGGPHDVTVKVQNTENHNDLRCEARGHYEAKPKIRSALEALRDGRVPDRDTSLEEAEQELEKELADGRISEYSSPWDVLPNYLKDFSLRVNAELGEAVKRTVDVLRWRGAIHGPHSPLSSSRSDWSSDGKEWHMFPQGALIARLGISSHTVHIFERNLAGINGLLAAGAAEPLGHRLFREAWGQRAGNPRSALVIGVAALEVRLKELVSSLAPEAEWLVGNVPSPPLVRMLQEYLPLLPVKSKIGGKVLPPPQEIIESLKKGVSLRNQIAHTGGKPLKYDTLEEVLLAVRDVLWLLDYYGGFEWAYEHLRDQTKAQLGSP